MATYTVVSEKSQTLVASTVDTVNFQAGGAPTLTVINRGTSDISFTYAQGGATAATPTALGDDEVICPAGQTVTLTGLSPGVTQVKLISAGTPAYTVEAL